ncbi:MAG: hypothetical protein IT539_16290 [Bradyrhizobiaceae bacterium]|nr:hypothetical protein [Bradyrhizobiaceae bacterium]
MRIAAAALMMTVGVHAAFAVETPTSAYSRFDYETCTRMGDDDPIMERRCEGHDGIPVHWVNEPDSSSVSFGTEGNLGGEYDPRFTFAVAGDVVEWRGVVVRGKLVPYAAIVRYQLCRTINGPCAPELAVYRLIGKRASCIAATVNGRRPDANLRASEIADDFARSFDCEKDKRRAPE